MYTEDPSERNERVIECETALRQERNRAERLSYLYEQALEHSKETNMQLATANAEITNLRSEVATYRKTLDEVCDLGTTYIAERDALRTAIAEMAERYRMHEGRFGGTGVAGELDAILNVAPAAENATMAALEQNTNSGNDEYTDDDEKYLTTFGGMKWADE